QRLAVNEGAFQWTFFLKGLPCGAKHHKRCDRLERVCAWVRVYFLRRSQFTYSIQGWPPNLFLATCRLCAVTPHHFIADGRLRPCAWHGMNVSACWSNGLTWETCCRNFLANDCWRPPLTYETCCVLRAESTADARGFILPETPQALLAVQRLEAATGVSARLAWPKGQLLVKWRQSWLCPPPAARQRTSGCEHAAYDNLWAKARTFTELALETAQAAPGDERHAKSFASLLLLAGSVEELHCILRYWHCFEAAHSAFDQVCAIIDLVLLQLASLLGEAPEAFSPWLGQGSFCSQALQRGVNDILQFVLFWVFQRFDQRLRIISQAVRWSDYLARSSGSQEEFGKYMELNPPRGQFYHFSRAVEFNPVCEDLQRYGTRNFYSGFWHRPWLDTTQSLTWHLFIHADASELVFKCKLVSC
ncbi:unnamed protein product, partial [Effrenium voratum]